VYIVDGIAYAGEKEKPLKVISVRHIEDYKLWLRFSNGEERICDFAPFLEYPVFRPLKDKRIFSGVYVDYGIPVWCDGDIDICPDTLYANGVAVRRDA
jgi:hypothetical protein